LQYEFNLEGEALERGLKAEHIPRVEFQKIVKTAKGISL